MDTTTNQPTQARVREELAQWREAKKNGVWKMLVGSGLPVRLRRLSLLQMVKAGVLPAALKPKADKAWTTEGLKLDELVDLMDLVDEQLMQAILEPKPVRRAAEADGDYCIGMDEITPDEKLILFNWLNAPPARLTDFFSRRWLVVELHSIAVAYGQRPSEIVGIRSRRRAYEFDASVYRIAMTPPEEAEPAPAKARYADPSHMVARQIEIPADGVW